MDRSRKLIIALGLVAILAMLLYPPYIVSDIFLDRFPPVWTRYGWFFAPPHSAHGDEVLMVPHGLDYVRLGIQIVIVALVVAIALILNRGCDPTAQREAAYGLRHPFACFDVDLPMFAHKREATAPGGVLFRPPCWVALTWLPKEVGRWLHTTEDYWPSPCGRPRPHAESPAGRAQDASSGSRERRR